MPFELVPVASLTTPFFWRVEIPFDRKATGKGPLLCNKSKPLRTWNSLAGKKLQQAYTSDFNPLTTKNPSQNNRCSHHTSQHAR